MSRVRWVVVALLGAGFGCGASSIAGDWSVSTEVIEQSAQGTTRRIPITDVVRLTANSWRIGGGCSVPLRADGTVATLERSSTCVVTDMTEPVFLASVLAKGPLNGQTLAVSRARFELLAPDRLQANVSFQIRTDANDPQAGPTFDYETLPDAGLPRLPGR